MSGFITAISVPSGHDLHTGITYKQLIHYIPLNGEMCAIFDVETLNSSFFTIQLLYNTIQ